MLRIPNSSGRWAALLLAGLACRFPPPPALLGKPCQTDSDCDGRLICQERLCDEDRPVLPLTAAFYELSFPEQWPTHDSPSFGEYKSDSSSVMAAHFNALGYAGIRTGIVAWDGRGGLADSRIERLLENTRSHLFRWGIEYTASNVEELALDVARIRSLLTESNHGLRINGRPVVFVRTSPEDDCKVLTRWAEANTEEPRLYLIVQTFDGWESCTTGAPDGFYPRDTSAGIDLLPGHAAIVRPGLWPVGSGTETLARDPQRFENDLRAMRDSGVPFQLIRSFNDWAQGTAVESSPRWATVSRFGTYLDLLLASKSN